MTEMLRRVAYVAALLTAIAAALSGPGLLLRISPVDFARDWERKYSPPPVMGVMEMAREILRADEPFIPLAAYIEAATQGFVLDLPEQEWASLTAALIPPPDRASPALNEALYLTIDKPPGAPAAALLDARDLVHGYFERRGEAGTQFFGLSVQHPSRLGGDAPASVRYPNRQWALWIFLAGLVFYFALPRRRLLSGSLRYARLPAGIIPDIGVATPLTAVFFVIPFLIVPDMSETGSILSFSEGSAYVTFVFWAMALFGLAVFAAAAWYSAFELLIRPDRLQLAGLSGVRTILFNDIERVEPATFGMPRWLERLLIVGSLFSWRVASQYLVLSGRQDPGLKLVFKDGSGSRILTGHLPGAEHIVPALRDAGVTIVTPDDLSEPT